MGWWLLKTNHLTAQSVRCTDLENWDLAKLDANVPDPVYAPTVDDFFLLFLSAPRGRLVLWTLFDAYLYVIWCR